MALWLKNWRIYACSFAALALAGCNQTTSINTIKPAKSQFQSGTSAKEYFAESEYGVSASPRVASNDYDTTDKQLTLVPIPTSIGPFSTSGSQAYALKAPAQRLKRGGGRDQTGKAYTVRGRTFVPRAEPGYDKTGLASWYGDAFHGRLTANGEVYDMNHLSAAHPTMPLPSYARVTSEQTGKSVIVRVNDRGPFAHNRVIDLSKRAGHVIGIKNQGVGTVRVQYLGRAPLHGQDDAFLLASYREGNANAQDDQNMLAQMNSGPNAIQVTQNQPVQVLAQADVLQVNSPIQTFAAPSAVLPQNSGIFPASPPLQRETVGQRTSIFGLRRPSAPLSYRSDVSPNYVSARIEAAHAIFSMIDNQSSK